MKPVTDVSIDAIRPFAARQVWTMIELQRLSGMRPGEVVAMRTIDVETTEKIWTYSPETHKAEHHGKRRGIHLGPKAQEILRPWLSSGAEEHLFSPAEAAAEPGGIRISYDTLRQQGYAKNSGSTPPVSCLGTPLLP